MVAFEDEYRSYRSAIASAIGMHRPHIEVTDATLGNLGDEVMRYDPT